MGGESRSGEVNVGEGFESYVLEIGDQDGSQEMAILDDSFGSDNTVPFLQHSSPFGRDNQQDLNLRTYNTPNDLPEQNVVMNDYTSAPEFNNSFLTQNDFSLTRFDTQLFEYDECLQFDDDSLSLPWGSKENGGIVGRMAYMADLEPFL